MNLFTVSVALIFVACIFLVSAVFFGIAKDDTKAFEGFAFATLIFVVAALCVAFVAVLLGQYQIPEVK